MRKFVLRLAATAGMLLALGACADSPTAPSGHPTAEAPLLDQTVSGCVGDRDGVCTLEPVYPTVPGDPGECDPYASLDWCGDDGDCLSSAPGGTDDPDYQGTAGCGEPREPIGYKPPATSYPKLCPDYGCPVADPYYKYDDDLASNCPGCGERAPTAAEKQTMEGLLSRVACEDGKSSLTSMLAGGTLQVYTDDNGLYGAWNSDNQTIYISRGKHWNATTGAVNGPELIDTMVHEVVHKLLGHVNGPQRHDQAWKDKMSACGFPQP